nr:15-hydroxyprostaglandin dehydrogenase [NAD(+)]-like [Onthophagus taurus]
MFSSLRHMLAPKTTSFIENCRLVLKKEIHSTPIPKNLCGDDCKGTESGIFMEPACKVALVTGGSSGIGLAIAESLLRNKAKHVAVTGVNVDKGKEAISKLNGGFGHGKAMFINANLTCMSQLEETYRVVKDVYGNIDIVINCAGIIDGKHWEREVVTNVIGTIRGSLLAYKYIGKEGVGKGGAMINVCGLEGITPAPSAPTFASTQHAIVGLSTSFGDNWHVARTGVRVITLLVGATNTSFTKGLESKGMSPALGQEMQLAMNKAKKQSPSAVGQAAVHVIRCGKSGSIWVIEGSHLYEILPISWDKHKKLAAQFI